MVAIGLATVVKRVTQITYVMGTRDVSRLKALRPWVLRALRRRAFNLDTSLVPVT